MIKLSKLLTSKKRKGGYIERFLKKADNAIEEGIKRADEALEDAVEYGKVAADVAQKKSNELHKHADREQKKLKLKGAKIGKRISAAKDLTTKNKELETLEKLGKLRKNGIITEKEFQQKKKKILSKI